MNTIIIDTREKNPFAFANYDTEVSTLKTGDYSLKGLEDQIVLERKSMSDFYSSVTKKRFWNEMERMSQIPHAYLILEFGTSDIMRFPHGSGIPKKVWKYLKASPKFLLSCVNRIENEYGVEVIYSSSREDAAKKAMEILLRGV